MIPSRTKARSRRAKSILINWYYSAVCTSSRLIFPEERSQGSSQGLRLLTMVVVVHLGQHHSYSKGHHGDMLGVIATFRAWTFISRPVIERSVQSQRKPNFSPRLHRPSHVAASKRSITVCTLIVHVTPK